MSSLFHFFAVAVTLSFVSLSLLLLLRNKMELDPITADFPSRTAREEDEEAAERATGGGLAPEAVAIVSKF